MIRVSRLLIALLTLAACGPVAVYHQPGGSVARLKSDLLDCRVEALDKAPVATQIRQGPPTYVPARTYCHRDGTCYDRGGFFAGGELYSVDVNARLRGDLEERCMARQGYRPVSLPRCSGAQSPQVLTGPGGGAPRLPELTAQSCAVRDTSGDWIPIDPAG